MRRYLWCMSLITLWVEWVNGWRWLTKRIKLELILLPKPFPMLLAAPASRPMCFAIVIGRVCLILPMKMFNGSLRANGWPKKLGRSIQENNLEVRLIITMSKKNGWKRPCSGREWWSQPMPCLRLIWALKRILMLPALSLEYWVITFVIPSY